MFAAYRNILFLNLKEVAILKQATCLKANAVQFSSLNCPPTQLTSSSVAISSV